MDEKQKKSAVMLWWRTLPLYHSDAPCKRLLAARHYKTEQSFLTYEQILNIWELEFKN